MGVSKKKIKYEIKLNQLQIESLISLKIDSTYSEHTKEIDQLIGEIYDDLDQLKKDLEDEKYV